MDKLAEMMVFTRVIECGSFSGAARMLRLTPSAVSKQIARLEDRLDARLINRTTRRLKLSEEGEAFFQRCQHVFLAETEARRATIDDTAECPTMTFAKGRYNKITPETIT